MPVDLSGEQQEYDHWQQERSDAALAQRLQDEWDALDDAGLSITPAVERRQVGHKTEDGQTAKLVADAKQTGLAPESSRHREHVRAHNGGPWGPGRECSSSSPSSPSPSLVGDKATAIRTKGGGRDGDLADGCFNFSDLDTSVASIDLQRDIFAFDPAAIDVQAWPTRHDPARENHQRPSAPYALLSHSCVLLSATRSRLSIITILTNLLRVLMRHDDEALLPCIYLVSNHIAPPYDGIELGLGGSIVNRCIIEVTGKSARHLRMLWNKTGDPGDVAFEAKKDVKTLVGTPRPLEITRLFSSLHSIAKIAGPGSSAAKMAHVTRLLVASRGEETRFLVRTLHSHLRINAVRTTITSALARAFVLDGPHGRTNTAVGHCVHRADGAPNTCKDASGQLRGDEEEEEAERDWLLSAEETQGVLANPASAKQRNDPRRLRAMEKLSRAERLLREVRARHPNFGSIVPALLSGGLSQLAIRVPMRVGTPLSPMLGSITRSLPAMFDKLGSRPFVCEFKYDGQRVQIHGQHVPKAADGDPAAIQARSSLMSSITAGKGRWAGSHRDVYVRLFSRHLEDMTDKYPDIVDLVPILMGIESQSTAATDAVNGVVSKVEGEEHPSHAAITTTSFIMDAEVVAISLDGALLPFQTLANRSRKDVELQNVKVAVGVFAFDLMHINGRSLLKTSLRKRKELLLQQFKPCSPVDARIARFDYVKSLQSHQMDEVADFFELARQQKCEGIMVKSLDHHWECIASNTDDDENRRFELLSEELTSDLAQPNLDDNEDSGKGVNGRGKALLSTYEPDKRCESWLKVKKDYIEGMGDSLDLVPIGGRCLLLFLF